ncbi:UVI-1 [Parathielavia hyrcaniae]|uniref:UVI-1 n=1 Tax=Parathielavia hyrcaniae TaxID=113614 RepID=A0AAN6PWF2_9PEZI|nr:UVI-1 [Parathielavia hyrcaniae]
MVSLRSLVAAAALIAAPVVVALSAQQTADGLNMLSQKSTKLNGHAQSITVANGPLIVIGQGPFSEIISGYSDIISTANTLIAQQDATAAFVGADATLVYNAYRNFVYANQATLNILIGKAGLFSTVPVIGQPMAAVLRGVENVYDTIGFSLVDLVEYRGEDVKFDLNFLNDLINLTITKYEGMI